VVRTSPSWAISVRSCGRSD